MQMSFMQMSQPVFRPLKVCMFQQPGINSFPCPISHHKLEMKHSFVNGADCVNLSEKAAIASIAECMQMALMAD